MIMMNIYLEMEENYGLPWLLFIFVIVIICFWIHDKVKINTTEEEEEEEVDNVVNNSNT